MGLFEDPEIQKTYEKCKYMVKVWEHKFTKKYKRIPSKLDIREAPVDVRHAYRKYFQLKTAALEQSFMDIEGFNEEISENLSQNLENKEENDSAFQFQLSNDNFTEDCSNEIENSEISETIKDTENVETEISPQSHNETQPEDNTWGRHLNKRISPAESEHTKKDKAPSKPVQSISKKLFCGSRFNKRNPRKSLSFSQKKTSEVSFESPTFVSQSQPCMGIFKSEEALSGLEPEIRSSFMDKSVKIVDSFNKVISQPVSGNIINSLLQKRQKGALTRVDAGWLQRVAANTGVSLENLELSSQTISHSLKLVDNKNHNEVLETKIDYDSDDLIEDSDDEQNTRNISLFHIAKKCRISLESEIGKFMSPSQQIIEKKPLTNDSTFNLNLKENITNNIPAEKTTGCISEISRTTDYLSKEEVLPAVKIIENITTVSKNKELNLEESLEKLDLDDQVRMKENKKTLSKKRPQNNKVPKKKKIASKPRITKTPEANKSNNESPLRRSSRKNKVKASFEELSSGEEDPFASDNDDKDPEFVLEDERGSKQRTNVFDFKEIEEECDRSLEVIKTPKKGRNKSEKLVSEKSVAKKSLKAKKPEGENPEVSAKYELEFNVKPRIVAPRYGSIKKVIRKKIIENSQESMKDNVNKEEDTSLPKNKKQQAKEKLEKKIASGNLNDNFVTINLRKKIFARGKKGQTFSKYKKAMWKSKKKALYGPDMDMGGCDGGKLTCFNCGQEGHFAQKCKAEKGDGLLPLTETDEAESECPFPTLEDASKMAAESVLRIRKPKILIPKDKKETNNPDIDKHDSSENDLQSDEDWLEDIDEEILLAEATKLEEHVRKLDVQSYMDNVKVVEPYYNLKEDGDVIDTPSKIHETLSLFGHSSFRQGQEKAIMRILSGKSTLVTLSTGSGKSLCYQLPAYLYSLREPCITLVISPLVSLMEDQIMGIPKFLKAACLHTNQTPTMRQKIIEALTSGDINVLLISPEAVVAGEKQTGFGSILRKLPPIAFACIDEAHCVSQWSHNFRPSYLMICRVLRESLGVKTILGLTATATRATCESIITSLDIPDGFDGIISDIPLPNNLHLTVSKDANRDRGLLNLLLSERFKGCKSIIVYCTRREECERVAAFLRTSLKSEVVVESTNKKRKRLNLQAEPYHAGLSASRRRSVQNAFMSGDLRVVVATVAFGMGINKADIRAVIHFNMPNSFESYIQEVGRAGRDGLPAHCHVFLDSQGRDENELRRHVHANSIDRHVIRKLLRKIFIPCSCKVQCPKHEVAFSIETTVRALDIPEENISTLLCYLELHENKYIELLNPAYTTCKVISYGGPLQIRKAGKECPPLAMALALYPPKEGEDNVLEFPVVDVASAMGWESGICKHKLKNLEWTAVNNQPKRSTLSVQFSNLGFRLLAPGNLKDEQLDQALDSLYNRVVNQESKALKQLRAVHTTLSEVAEKSYMSCVKIDDEENGGANNVLKEKIRSYFKSSDPLADIGKDSPAKINEDQLINDIRAMICMYRDNQFTGRAIARIFHGIQSPNYPAVMWGRCKFWRSHLNEDFNEICRIATREIIRMR